MFRLRCRGPGFGPRHWSFWEKPMSKEVVHGGPPADATVPTTPAFPVPPRPTLLDMSAGRERPLPLSPEHDWFNTLIGQFVQGFVYLLAGQPGSRKSGLTVQ